MRFRLIKPDWGKPDIIEGPNTIEGDNFTPEFIKKKNESGYNVYYFPNGNSKPIDHPFLRGADVDVYKYCFVDMDLKDGVYTSCDEFLDLLAGDPLPPNKVVLSGNGVHAYWNVTNLTMLDYLEIQLRLIQKFKTDQSVWSALQLMRWSQSVNTKNKDNFKPVEELVLHETEVTVDDLKSILPELTRDNKRKLDMHVHKLAGVEHLEGLDDADIVVPEKFHKLIEKSSKLQRLFSAEKGSRSDADFQIATILYDKDYTKTEALAVIMNTDKAKEKGVHGRDYAISVVTAAYMKKVENYVPSAAEKIAKGVLTKQAKGRPVNGPKNIDALMHSWRTSEILGLVGSSGVGKTTFTLDIFYNMIKNSPDDDDIFIFFSLEMEDYKIIEQWAELTHDRPDLSERFFVVSNEDEDGNSRFLNLQDIYNYIKDTAKVQGKKVKAVAIDHIGIINKSIDIKRKPDFGLATRDDLGFGNNRTLSDRELTKFLKSIAKELDCFMVIQSQTTKEKASEGDIQLGLGAAYGVAQFEWDMDYVITIWQPLKRVRNRTDLTVTAFQYAKNRYIHSKDSIKCFDPRLIYLDTYTGRFRPLADDELIEFDVLVKEANALRKMSEKKEGSIYRNSADIDKVMSIVKSDSIKQLHLVEDKSDANESHDQRKVL